MHVWAFLGVTAVVVLTPGPDMALVTKNAVLHGRRAALGTALGVNAGLVAWTIASAVGVAAVVRASAPAFDALRLAGAAYLIALGIGALRASRRSAASAADETDERVAVSGWLGFRQGLLSNLANPKIAVFFTSLLPQFVSRHDARLVPLLILGAVFVLFGVLWLSVYAVAATRASAALRRPRVKAALDRITGIVLIGLGIRIAAEHR